MKEFVKKLLVTLSTILALSFVQVSTCLAGDVPEGLLHNEEALVFLGEVTELEVDKITVVVTGNIKGAAVSGEEQAKPVEKTAEEQIESEEKEEEADAGSPVSIGIIGGADGPTSIFLAGKIGTGTILGIILAAVITVGAAVASVVMFIKKK